MTKNLTIFGRAVGFAEPVLVIAEIGVNHDGSMHRAMELVEAAAECGADAVKLQVFRAQSLLHESVAFADYQKERCTDGDPATMLRRYELEPQEIERLVEAIRDHQMIPIATPFSPSDVTLLAQFGMPAVKIASPDVVNRPLLLRAAGLRKPMLVSTGASTMEEISQAASWLRGWNASFAFLHCVSSYPTPALDAHLCWIGELAARFNVPVGYSDHTQEVLGGALAVTAGACVIEKHLTYDRTASGPDHAASADPSQFREYVRSIRLAEKLRGRPGKRVLALEEDVRRVSRQSLVLCRDLQRGDILRDEDLIVQRPGTGIPAAMSDRVIGRKILRPLEAGTLLQWDMFGHAA